MKKRDMKAQDLIDTGIVSHRIAYNIAGGATNITLNTLAKLCRLFEVRFLDDLVAYDPEQE